MLHEDEDPVNWQPIHQMPLIARMIDGALDDTREHLETLAEAWVRPHVLDDATLDRVEQVHAEQMQFVDTYIQQISRWRTENHQPIKRASWTGWRRRTGSSGPRPRTSSRWPANCAKAPSSAS